MKITVYQILCKMAVHTRTKRSVFVAVVWVTPRSCRDVGHGSTSKGVKLDCTATDGT
jgi:hypothetical protein